MLTRIAIRNLVIVRELDIEFRAGMTALTGETGAGKSILIDALGLALGDKSDANMVRSGADKAEVSVCFDLPPGDAAREWLDRHDLDADGECLLRRVLVRGGRSRAYINGSPATQALLRELGELLIDIHGQHAHQSLLRAKAQRQLLDDYAGLHDDAREVAELHKQWRAHCDDHDALRRASDERAKRLDYLRFQVAELEGVACDGDTLVALEQEHARLAHAERLLGETGQLVDLLDDAEPSLLQSLARANQSLGDLATLDASLDEARAMLDNASIQISEAVSLLRHYQSDVDVDPGRLQSVDEQLGQLHDLARKHRVEAGELLALLNGLRNEIDELDRADSTLAELDEQMRSAESVLRERAGILSKARSKAAKKLSKTVTASMQTLAMPGGRFDIEVRTDAKHIGAHGIDHITFRVAANPGQAPGALADVASGGELSRISLAIQVATADCGSVPTLIFDEVDVGIGGAVAEIVGQLLRRLGEKRQILCVTHLAQVASQAHQQMRVHKVTDGKSTETRVDSLDASNRIDEIARMMGGVDITEQTRRHADEMIRQAQRAS